jgi:putative PIN family toxin of toxin-antitoxin system
VNESKPLRVVLDTNICVSAVIAPRGAAAEVVRARRAGAFEALVTPEQHIEIEDVLRRPRISIQFNVPLDEIDVLLDLIKGSMEDVIFQPHSAIQVRDIDDIPILAAALDGHANYLVTGDKDLLVLADEPAVRPLRIVTVREPLDVLAARE